MSKPSRSKNTATLSRETLNEQIRQFQQRGGKIEKIANGISGMEGQKVSKHIKISKK